MSELHARMDPHKEFVRRVDDHLREEDGWRREHLAMEAREDECGCSYGDCYDCGRAHNCLCQDAWLRKLRRELDAWLSAPV